MQSTLDFTVASQFKCHAFFHSYLVSYLWYITSIEKLVRVMTRFWAFESGSAESEFWLHHACSFYSLVFLLKKLG